MRTPLLALLPAAFLGCEPAQQPVTLKMDRFFRVEVRFGSHTGQFLLDTGANGTSIDPRRAAEWGIPVSDTETTTTGSTGQQIEGRLAPGIGGLRLGSIELAPVDLFVVPLPAAFHIDGVLGTDVLRRYAWKFDAPQRQVTIYPRGRAGKPVDGARVPFTIADRRPFVTLAVPGHGDVRMLLDSGCRGIAIPQREIAKGTWLPAGDVGVRASNARRKAELEAAMRKAGQHGTITVSQPETRNAIGIAGTKPALPDYFLPESHVGERRLGLLVVGSRDDGEGLLGGSVLAECAWTLDFLGGELWLGPRRTERSPILIEGWREAQARTGK